MFFILVGYLISSTYRQSANYVVPDTHQYRGRIGLCESAARTQPHRARSSSYLHRNGIGLCKTHEVNSEQDFMVVLGFGRDSLVMIHR